MLSGGQVFDGQPKVSPDGGRIAFISNRLGRDQLWMLHVDSKRMEVLQLPGDDISVVGPMWFPDGRRLMALRHFPNGKLSMWWIAADGSDAQELAAADSLYNNAEGWPISPDGRAVAYVSDEAGTRQTYVQPYPGPGPKVQVSTGWSSDPVWNPKGGELFFVDHISSDKPSGRMMVADIRTVPTLEVGPARPLFDLPPGVWWCWPNRCHDIAPDGQRFFVVMRHPDAQLPPRPAPVTQIHVILNFVEELKAKVPTGR